MGPLPWEAGQFELLLAREAKPQHEREMVMIGLFTAPWNSLYCAHDLALSGYYGQALNLLRLPLQAG
jgi:hypothetical protein